MTKASAAKLVRRDRAVSATIRVVAAAQGRDGERRRRQQKKLRGRAANIAADLCELDSTAEGGNRLVSASLGARGARELGSAGPRLVLGAAELAALSRPPADPATAGLGVAAAPAVAPPQGVFDVDE